MTQEATTAQTLVRGGTGRAEVAARPPATSSTGGATQIDDAVVARIAGIAAREVEGVHEMSGGSAFAALAGRVGGQEQPDRGVSVEVGQTECIVDLAIVVTFGASIPQVADALRRNVSTRLATMTGLTAKEINITVTDIYLSPQTQAQGSQQTRVQ